MSQSINRRAFLKSSLAAGALVGVGSVGCATLNRQRSLFEISLAEWSFNKALFSGEMDHLAFAKVAKQEFGLDGVE